MKLDKYFWIELVKVWGMFISIPSVIWGFFYLSIAYPKIGIILGIGIIIALVIGGTIAIANEGAKHQRWLDR